jgi:hypothetical protein
MTATLQQLRVVPGAEPKFHSLCYDDNFSTTVLSGIFAQMVERSRDVVEHYVGDLFHDAEWLRTYVTGPVVFYWTTREYGTYIGLEPFWLESNTVCTTYEVIVNRTSKRQWVVCFTEIEIDR